MKKIAFGLLIFMLAFIVSFSAQAAFEPPTSDVPTTVEECKKDGWEAYLIFKNQGDCVSFIATEGKNEPALLP